MYLCIIFGHNKCAVVNSVTDRNTLFTVFSINLHFFEAANPTDCLSSLLISFISLQMTHS